MKNKLKKIFKEIFDFEFQRKERIENYLKFRTSIFLVLLGASGYYIKHLDGLLNLQCNSILFFEYFTISVIVLCFAGYFLLRALCGYKYFYHSSPSDITNYIERLEKHYKNSYFHNLSDGEKKRLMEDKIDAFLLDSYKKCADKNIFVNDKKASYARNLSKALAIATIFLFLTSGPFFFQCYNNYNQEQEEELKMAPEEKSQEEQAPEEQAPAEQAPEENVQTEPEEPTPPPLRELHEGAEAPVKKDIQDKETPGGESSGS